MNRQPIPTALGDQLETIRPAGEGWSARCPAHPDNSPSLSVTPHADGKTLIYCHAGCTPDAILQAVGLTWADLSAPRDNADQDTWTPHGPAVAVYPYVDETRAVLFEVCRTADKSFPQRRPDPTRKSGWTWSLGDVRRVLYRLPQLIEAVADGRHVWVCEGEKDVHALLERGEIATCNPGGAGKWRLEYVEHFRDAYVTVCADADDPGRAHARAVSASLAGVARKVRIVEAQPPHKDIAAHLGAGLDLTDDLLTTRAETPTPATGQQRDLMPLTAVQAERHLRKLVVVRASSITVRPVHWFWADRVPLGSLSLLAGREGIGKSTVAYQLAADLTRGTLPGAHLGTPKSVVVAATEDSWEHTIVPRLMAAGADLHRVLRVDVQTSEGLRSSVTLPRDTGALADLVEAEDVGLVLLDPLMSRLDGKLDSHKDAEVRIALEPITDVADRTGAAVLGIIHVNKGRGADALDRIMGSKAFPAVARSVLFVMKDPDDENLRLLGTPKNNLGRTDNLSTLTFRIESCKVADTAEGPVWTGKVAWQGEITRSIDEALQSTEDGPDGRSATSEAAEWLTDYLTSEGGEAGSAEIKRDGAKAGHGQDALKRARRQIKAESRSHGFPRRTVWSLPGTVVQSAQGQPQSEQDSRSSLGESAPIALTALTAPTEVQSVQSVQSVRSPGPAPTDSAAADAHDDLQAGDGAAEPRARRVVPPDAPASELTDQEWADEWSAEEAFR